MGWQKKAYNILAIFSSLALLGIVYVGLSWNLSVPSPPPKPVPPKPPMHLIKKTPPRPWPLQTLRASFYGDPFHLRRTANGEIFDKNLFTAAHPTWAFGTNVKLRNPKNGKTLWVRINDRGPFAEWKGVRYFEGERHLDVSEAAAEALGFKEAGVVTLEVLARHD